MITVDAVTAAACQVFIAQFSTLTVQLYSYRGLFSTYTAFYGSRMFEPAIYKKINESFSLAYTLA